MEKIIFIAFLSLSFAACIPHPTYRHTLPNEDRTIVFIDRHQKSKEEAFVIVTNWINKNYTSTQSVIQKSDKEAGHVLMKADYPFVIKYWPVLSITPFYHVGTVRYNVSLEVKDQKMKIEFITGAIVWQYQMVESARYFPEEEMPKLKSHYQSIRAGLLDALLKENSDF
jgi:hypothetical protein